MTRLTLFRGMWRSADSNKVAAHASSTRLGAHTPASHARGTRAALVHPRPGRHAFMSHVPAPAANGACRLSHSTSVALLLCSALLVAPVFGANDSSPATADEPIQLQAFQVNSQATRGYDARDSVTATRTAIKTAELPFSVDVITNQLLTDIGAVEVEDMTRFLAVGVNKSSGDLGTGRVNTRGFTTNDTKRNGFVLRAAAILGNPYTDRIEIVKGPASALYGIGRPGGSVNIISKQPFAENTAILRTTVGEFNQFDTLIDVGGPIAGGKVRTRLVIDDDRKDSFADNVFRHRQFIGAGVAWFPSASTKVSVDINFNYTHERRINRAPTTNELTGTRSVVPGLPQNFSYFPDGNGFISWFRETSVWFTLVHSFGNGWVYRSAIESVNMPQDRRERGPRNNGAVNPDGVTVNIADTRRRFFDRSVIAQNDLMKTFKIGSVSDQVLIGAQYEYSKFVTNDYATNLDNYPIFNRAAQLAFSGEPANWATYAGATTDRDRRNQSPSTFAINQLSFLDDKLKLLTGGRYERNHEIRTVRKGAAASDITYPFKDYQLGLTYLPTKEISAYVSTSTASKNNPNFPSDPEHGKGYEAGVKFNTEDRTVSASLSAFKIDEQNIEKSLGNGIFALSGGEQSRGIEAEVYYSPVKHWQSILSYAHVSSKVVFDTNPNNLGQPLADAPRNAFGWWNRYNISKQFGLGAGVRYQDKTRINGTLAYLAASTVYDAAAYYNAQLGRQSYTLQVNVLNLTNQFYGSSGEYYQPREIRVSVSVKF